MKKGFARIICQLNNPCHKLLEDRWYLKYGYESINFDDLDYFKSRLTPIFRLNIESERRCFTEI